MKIINKKAIILLLSLGLLGVYFLTPQFEVIPDGLKRIVFSCLREGEAVPTMPNGPKCCIGLSEEYPESELTEDDDENLKLPALGALKVCTPEDGYVSSTLHKYVNTPTDP